MEKQELQDRIRSLEAEIAPLRDELNKIYAQESNETEARIKDCYKLKNKFQLDELRFSAFSRCSCGAGLAYPKNTSIHGSWYCSAILLGSAEKGTSHDEPLSFVFYDVKSEGESSCNGSTTRPA